MGRRDHRITGTKKDRGSPRCAVKQLVRVLLHVCPHEKPYGFLVECFELFPCRPHEPGRVSLKKNMVCTPDEGKPFLRDVVFVVEAKADKGKHVFFRVSGSGEAGTPRESWENPPLYQ